MRHRRTGHATLALLAVGAAGAALPLACGTPGLTSSAGSGGSSSSHASSGHASSGHAGGGVGTTGSSATAGTGGASGTGGAHGTGGAIGTGGAHATGGASGTGGVAASTTGSASASSGSAGTGGAGTGGAPETTVTLHPNDPPLPGETSCTVVEVSNIPEPDFNHLAICTPITYGDPPSGGNHWPIWAQYTQYTSPIPREMYVHDLEHGAIVLSYNCPTGCPAVVSALQQVFASQVDPLCQALGGPLARMVLTPDPLLSTPIAASAWGATYTATCIDTASLLQFVQQHYAHGRENFCTDGFPIPDCSDAGADGGDGG